MGTRGVTRPLRVATAWTRARSRLVTASFRAVPPEQDNECAISYVLGGAPKWRCCRGFDRQPDSIVPPPFSVLERLRAPRWRSLGRWFRVIGLALVVFVIVVPLPVIAVTALVAPGLVMFTIGALAWLARDAESWRR